MNEKKLSFLPEIHVLIETISTLTPFTHVKFPSTLLAAPARVCSKSILHKFYYLDEMKQIMFTNPGLDPASQPLSRDQSAKTNSAAPWTAINTMDSDPPTSVLAVKSETLGTTNKNASAENTRKCSTYCA